MKLFQNKCKIKTNFAKWRTSQRFNNVHIFDVILGIIDMSQCWRCPHHLIFLKKIDIQFKNKKWNLLFWCHNVAQPNIQCFSFQQGMRREYSQLFYPIEPVFKSNFIHFKTMKIETMFFCLLEPIPMICIEQKLNLDVLNDAIVAHQTFFLFHKEKKINLNLKYCFFFQIYVYQLWDWCERWTMRKRSFWNVLSTFDLFSSFFNLLKRKDLKINKKKIIKNILWSVRKETWRRVPARLSLD